MNLKNVHVIPHMIEEVLDFKTSIKPYIQNEVSSIDRTYEGIPIPVLYARIWCPCYAIQDVVHNIRLKPAGGSSCIAC